ncbi:MAG: hypothetical protein ABIR59_02060 [Gemmatimonadales bacterium]
MLTCRDVARHIASASRDVGAPAPGMMLRLHLLLCRDCRRYARELRDLGNALRHGHSADGDPEKLRKLEQRIIDLGFPQSS